jgi:hypothetical protein
MCVHSYLNGCVNIKWDSANCGTPGHACPSGTACDGTGNCACVETMCGSQCVDTSWNPNFCGNCSTACASDEMCCSGVCKAILTDPQNCGGCQASCTAVGMACCSGNCISTTGDVANGGGCNAACAAGQSCCNSSCLDTFSTDNQCGSSCSTAVDCTVRTDGNVNCCNGVWYVSCILAVDRSIARSDACLCEKCE